MFDIAFIPESLFAEFIRNMPICTVDVLLFNPRVTKVLLFRRTNEPLKGEWFSLGGRISKNETLQQCALRQVYKEAGLTLAPADLFFGTVFDEIFSNSRFGPGVSLHCVNICWGHLLDDGAVIRLDEQHDRCEWRRVNDPSLHPMMKRKIDALLPLAFRAARQAESGLCLMPEPLTAGRQ